MLERVLTQHLELKVACADGMAVIIEPMINLGRPKSANSTTAGRSSPR